jgi:hypothetical protein
MDTSTHGHLDEAGIAVTADKGFNFVAPIVHALELHLSSDATFTSGTWARKVKNLDGKYSECRGYDDTRFVVLPNTAPGRKLAAELMAKFPHFGPFSRKNRTGFILRDIEGDCMLRGDGEANFTVLDLDPRADTLAQLGTLLTRFEERCRSWWERVGRKDAIMKAERAAAWEAECRAASKARAPGNVIDAVRSAASLCYSRNEIVAWVTAALGDET